jgi:uncharacterized membrane protein YbhN (UPF0104 family)
MQRRSWGWVRWLSWVLGLVLVLVLVRQVGPRAVLGAFTAVGPRLLWLVIAYAAATALMALPWTLLLPAPLRPSLGATMASRFAASGLNAILPFSGAGEVSRLLWLPASARPEGAAALLVDRLAFGLSSVAMLCAGALAAHSLPRVPRQLGLAVAGGAVLLVAVMLLAGLLLLRGRGLGVFARFAPISKDIHAALRALANERGRFAAALVLHLGGRVLAALEIYVALRALGQDVGAAEVAVFAAVPLALALVGALVPGQIGLQEGAQAAVAAALGLGAPVGLTVVLLQRARQLLFVPLTGALFALRPHPADPRSYGGEPASP